MGRVRPATGLPARTRPGPVLPPEPAPVPEPTPAPTLPAQGPPPGAEELEAAVPRAARPWEYELGVGGGGDTNIDLLAPHGPGRAAAFPPAGLAPVVSSPRGPV